MEETILMLKNQKRKKGRKERKENYQKHLEKHFYSMLKLNKNMPRVKRGKHHIKRRKNILKQAKGYKWGRKNKLKLAITAVRRAGAFAYVGRKRKKRDFRRLWQVKINAACRNIGLSYSKFIAKLKKNKIEIDRKILADLAENNPEIFNKIVESVK